MDHLVRRPLAWTALCVLLGSWIGAGISFSLWMLALPGALMLVSAALLWKMPDRGWGWISIFLCCGALACCATSRGVTPPPLPAEGRMEITGRVVSVPQLKEDRATVLLADVRLADGTAVHGKVWLYYKPNPNGEPEGIPLMAEALPAIGQQVRAEARLRHPGGARNPGGFDFARYLARQGSYLAAYVYDAWEITGNPTPHLLTWMAKARNVLMAKLDDQYGALAPYMRGMLLGDKEEIDGEGQRAIRDSGLSHLLAVSGLHVGFIALPVLWLLKRLRLRLMVQWLLLAAVLGTYCLLVGAPASSVRACVMLLILQGAPLAGRRYDPISALSAAFLLFFPFQPLALWDMGFVLSFSAMLGIFLVGERIKKLTPKWPRWPREMVAVSLGAQLGCLPWTARYFGEVQLLGLFTNLLAVPLAGFVVQLGLVGLFLGFLWQPLAAPLVMVVSLLLHIILGVAGFVASIPFATLRMPAPGLFAIAAYFVLMALLYPRFLLRKSLRRVGVGLTLGVVLMSLWIAFPKGVRYVQVDVGQGDAALLHAAGHTTVIDTGKAGSGGLLDVLRFYGLMVDTLCISHPDADHAGALVDLLEAGMPIGRIVVPTDLTEADFDEEVLLGFLRAQEQGIPVQGLYAGEALMLPGGVQAHALGPVPGLGKTTNDRSLVLMLEAEGVRILTTGDAGEMVEPLRDTACDVLKVAHHGAAAATSEVFLRYARPEIALISVSANNSYGHPTPQVLERLDAAGATVYRTDRCGAITLLLEDEKIQVIPYLKNGEAI